MAEFAGFDLDLTTKRAWDEFALRLGEVLSVMDQTADLSIFVDGETHVLKFSANESGEITASLTGVASSRQLLNLGWRVRGEHTHEICETQEDADQLARVATQTMSDVLGVIHPIFLEPDQLTEILRLETPDALPRLQGPYGGFMPKTKEQLDNVVDVELTNVLGHRPMRNEQGDVAVRIGSAAVFLRSTTDLQELILFSVLVHDVVGQPRTYEILNDLNVQSRYCRFALHQDRLFVQVSVPAQPFVPAHLHQALLTMSRIADGIDDELAEELGGRTTFPTTAGPEA